MTNDQQPFEPYPARREGTPRGLIRASDADRERVADALGAAFSEGRLTRDEHDTRLDEAMRARTLGELEPLTADLGPLPEWPQAPRAAERRPGRAWTIDTRGANSSIETLFAVFGGGDRRLRRARRRISDFVMFGGNTIDLREAVFESNVCEIDVFCMFGGIDVKIPEGVDVDNQTIAVFGGSDTKRLPPPDPGAPTVVVRGFVAFGGLTVKGGRPAASADD